MTPTLIVIVLLVLAVGIVVWAIRKKPAARSYDQRLEQDTAWNDPVGSTRTPPADGEKLP